MTIQNRLALTLAGLPGLLPASPSFGGKRLPSDRAAEKEALRAIGNAAKLIKIPVSLSVRHLEGRKSGRNKRPLIDVLDHFRKIETFVEPDINYQVQTTVEECEQAK